jgi:hypothetical protein
MDSNDRSLPASRAQASGSVINARTEGVVFSAVTRNFRNFKKHTSVMEKKIFTSFSGVVPLLYQSLFCNCSPQMLIYSKLGFVNIHQVSVDSVPQICSSGTP